MLIAPRSVYPQDPVDHMPATPVRLPIAHLSDARLAGVSYGTMLTALTCWRMKDTIWHRRSIPAWWSLVAHQPEIPGEPWPIESVLFDPLFAEPVQATIRVCLHTARFGLSSDQTLDLLDGRDEIFYFCAGPKDGRPRDKNLLQVDDLGYGLAIRRDDGISVFIGRKYRQHRAGIWEAMAADLDRFAVAEAVEVEVDGIPAPRNDWFPSLRITDYRVADLKVQVVVRGAVAGSQDELVDEINKIINCYNYATVDTVLYAVRVSFKDSEKSA